MNKNQSIFLRVLTIFLIIILSVSLAGCRKKQTPRQIKQVHTLRYGLPLQPSSALSIIAQEQGFFIAEGLQVEIAEYPSGKRALQDGLLAGEVDIATSADIPIVFNILSGKEFRIVTAINSTDDVNRIIARRDSGITKPADIAGKTIATQKASAVHYFMHLFLLKQGLTKADVDIKFYMAEDLPKELAAGTIDDFFYA